MNARNASGEAEPELSVPSFASAWLIAALFSASFVTEWSRAMISGGVPAGTKKPYQKESS